jgi:phage shock protein A
MPSANSHESETMIKLQERNQFLLARVRHLENLADNWKQHYHDVDYENKWLRKEIDKLREKLRGDIKKLRAQLEAAEQVVEAAEAYVAVVHSAKIENYVEYKDAQGTLIATVQQFRASIDTPTTTENA